MISAMRPSFKVLPTKNLLDTASLLNVSMKFGIWSYLTLLKPISSKRKKGSNSESRHNF